MKKTIITIGIILAMIVVALPIEHYYGDNIYGAFAFHNGDVIMVSDTQFRTHKDNPKCFYKYMEQQGWTLANEEMGSCKVFENDTQIANCVLEFKELYAEYNVTYESKNYDVEYLKETYPEYFFTDNAFKGIEIYVWQDAENYYQCGAMIGTNRDKTIDEISGLFERSISIEDMNKIIAYCGIKKEDTRIIPCKQLYSSYFYEIDDEYIKNVESMFVFE